MEGSLDREFALQRMASISTMLRELRQHFDESVEVCKDADEHGMAFATQMLCEAIESYGLAMAEMVDRRSKA